jgi:formylglycine-generating enzyme required for sulfatase activity/serine/threonine protein kinase
MFCNHCGTSNANGSTICTACGKRITSQSYPSKPGASPFADKTELGPISASPSGAPHIVPDLTELGLVHGYLLANRYRILRMLGVGGMGRVYLAEDEKLGERVAIKVLQETLSRDPGSVQRLIAEAKLAIKLTHSNVVRVNHFEDGELLKFLVMEYVEGETLAHKIARDKKLPEAEARRMAIEICSGLAHAHQKKVIHRDIKPGNILLSQNGEIKIADFGIARECRDSVSRLTSLDDSGTRIYMSPEQLLGKSSEASDIYSLGIVLYEMLTGAPPFQTGDISYQIREIVPDPPAGVARELSAIVLKCLEKKPERRFGSVAQLREKLEGKAEQKMEEERRAAGEMRQKEEIRHAEQVRQQREAEERKRADEAKRLEDERRQAWESKRERLKRRIIQDLEWALPKETETALNELANHLGSEKDSDPDFSDLQRQFDNLKDELRQKEEEKRRSAEERRRKEEEEVEAERKKVEEAAQKKKKDEELLRQAEQRKTEERRAAELRKAEQERLRIEEQRIVEESRRRVEEKRKAEERQKQVEIEANRWREEERHKREEARKVAEEVKKIAAGLIEPALPLLDQGFYSEAEAKLGEAETKLHKALKLDPANTEAQAALERCRAERAAAKVGKQRQESQEAAQALLLPKYFRRVAIGVLVVGIIVVVGLMVADWRNKEQASPSAGPSSKTSSSPVDTKAIASVIPEMEFVSIPAGKFTMGCPTGDSQCNSNENPRHKITITRSFELGKNEVTQGQWVKVMGNNPSNFKGDDRLPVEQVSWNNAQVFLAKLNALNDGYRYRLPTEAEWEYAARGGSAMPYSGSLDAIAWYDSNSGGRTHPVGQKQPIGYGLNDMLGNVWEWCSDWHGENYYDGSPAADPTGPASGQYRVLRGGSWNYGSGLARVSSRGRGSPDGRYNADGFRVCRENR